MGNCINYYLFRASASNGIVEEDMHALMNVYVV